MSRTGPHIRGSIVHHADTLEAPPAGPDNRPTTGSEDRDRDVMMVRDLFYKARDARRPLMRQWKQWYKTLNNRTWSSALRAGGEPTSEIPQMWPVLASMVAWMTDQRPILSTMAGGSAFSPHNDFYDKLAKDMNAVLESQYVELLRGRRDHPVPVGHVHLRHRLDQDDVGRHAGRWPR
jgi:hypothetical protein